MDLILVQAMWVLGFISSDQLPELAAEALVSGSDCDSLRVLSGLLPSESAEAPEIFLRALKELSMPELSRSDAAHRYAIAISMKIVDQTLPARAGAEKLWDASLRVDDPQFHDLDTFIYAASELQSRPEDEEFFTREILREAERWASKS
jgi:hypothetical protein